jgi:3-oxoacyl-[acyl-carrier protein] reductase
VFVIFSGKSSSNWHVKVSINTVAYGLIETRLTASKAAGETITVGGKKIALGLPGGGPPKAAAGPSPIPLQRPGNADEAAAGILL